MLYRRFPHSNEQGPRVEVRVDENTRKNVHPNPAVVLLFLRTELECGNGRLVHCDPHILPLASQRVSWDLNEKYSGFRHDFEKHKNIPTVDLRKPRTTFFCWKTVLDK